MLPTPGPMLRQSARFLRRRRPGRALALLARAPLPVLATNWHARRLPEDGLAENADVSPLIEPLGVQAAAGAGPLDGATVAVKDAVDVAGLRTGLGLRDGGDVADADALIVSRVRAAGGRIVGKAKMTELGMDGLGALMHQPMPPNPRAPGYFPGGSSTGTAVAVASGVARYGVGGDGLGSIRIPAAFCGLVGLKPTHGRLPAAGYPSPAPSLDVPGPIARSADDCARLFQILAGEPVRALTARTPTRVGVLRQLGPDRACRSIRAAFTRMLSALRVQVATVELPGAEGCTFLGGMLGAFELAHGPYAARDLSAAGHMTVALGRSFDDRDAARLDRQREDLRDATAQALSRAPVLAMPTTAVPPPALTRALLDGGQDLLLLRALGAYTPLANLTGLPAIAVPCGVDDRGRPLSIMFMTCADGETELLELALAVEQTGLGVAPISGR